MQKDYIDVFTDGSLVRHGRLVRCGYGIYFPNGEYKSISRNFNHEPITNNRAELYAILKTIVLCHKIQKSRLHQLENKSDFENENIEIINVTDKDNDILTKSLNMLLFNYCTLDNFIIIDKPLIKYLYQFITENILPDWLFLLSKDQCMLLFEVIDINTDLYLSNYNFANQLLHLSIHAGLICNIIESNECWKFEIVNTNKFNNSNYTTYNYEGDVFCVEVPSQVFMVKTNGKASWTGNSRARGFVTILTHQPPEGYGNSLCVYGKDTRKCYIY